MSTFVWSVGQAFHFSLFTFFTHRSLLISHFSFLHFSLFTRLTGYMKAECQHLFGQSGRLFTFHSSLSSLTAHYSFLTSHFFTFLSSPA
jgi:hypothetical protein